LTLLPIKRSNRRTENQAHTQHSVAELRGIGIHPDCVGLPRPDYPITPDLLDKIALSGDVDREAVIPVRDGGNDL
jgi:CTP synthase